MLMAGGKEVLLIGSYLRRYLILQEGSKRQLPALTGDERSQIDSGS